MPKNQSDALNGTPAARTQVLRQRAGDEQQPEQDLTVNLNRRPPATVRLAIVFTSQGGANQTRAVLVKRSR